MRVCIFINDFYTIMLYTLKKKENILNRKIKTCRFCVRYTSWVGPIVTSQQLLKCNAKNNSNVKLRKYSFTFSTEVILNDPISGDM